MRMVEKGGHDRKDMCASLKPFQFFDNPYVAAAEFTVATPHICFNSFSYPAACYSFFPFAHLSALSVLLHPLSFPCQFIYPNIGV